MASVTSEFNDLEAIENYESSDNEEFIQTKTRHRTDINLTLSNSSLKKTDEVTLEFTNHDFTIPNISTIELETTYRYFNNYKEFDEEGELELKHINCEDTDDVNKSII